MINEIKKTFGNRDPEIIGQLRKNAVMILLCEEDGKTSIVFEVRAFCLRQQPGDICLPGGKVEKGESPEVASIRETTEELNLKIDDIEFIGSMDYVVTPYNFIIYPFIGKLNKREIFPNRDEVDHIFKVPIEFFIENTPEFYEISLMPDPGEGFPYHLIRNGKDYKFRIGKVPEYFYRYKDYVIWGFTALIIKNFIEVLRKAN
ncbi:NUDIX hydrolase [Clostridium magnum]|uniref:Putative nudix hydrolase NudL n=1 Tax=Clostridium magnum DSM 2767 TaxID=1121326 RepID=A0A161W121_9CLOT|nr:CoA pyrophosphatase [Clostridium magnum]KZL88840.1 putative nudix hydrolase NudL [Clostridium magnum DSM 2767]SHI76754.1 ADP-ribose pyrophosphatase YjhB, NUDIX family [Clostridium magnum DSM 2767]